MAQAKMEIVIEEDGTISVKTEGIPGEHHASADEFLADLERLAGGTRTTKHRGPKKKIHTHTHDHVHQGGGHTH